MDSYLNRKIQIKNALSGEEYTLTPLHEISPTKDRLNEVKSICNEPLVYKWCFKELCKGSSYPEKLAVEWFQWSKSGWEEDTHYVYAVLDNENRIAADLDRANARSLVEKIEWVRLDEL